MKRYHPRRARPAAPHKGLLLGALCLLLCLWTLFSLALDDLTLHRSNPEQAEEIAENVAALAQAGDAPLPELNPSASAAAPEQIPDTSPVTDPEQTPDTSPDTDPEQTPDTSSETDPEQIPGTSSETDPEQTPGTSSEPDPGRDPGNTSDTGPEQQPDLQPLSLSEEQAKILAMDRKSVTKAQLLRRFSNAVILGDSIVEAARAYEYLDDAHVFSKIGISMVSADELFDAAIKAKPATVFLGFGLNDVNLYTSHADRYVEQYRQRIEELQAALPHAELYAIAILPVESWVDQTDYQYIPDYNAGLKALCEETGAHYVDAGFLLTEMPELYDADGIHPKGNFYTYWLTYLADLAGL